MIKKKWKIGIEGVFYACHSRYWDIAVNQSPYTQVLIKYQLFDGCVGTK